MSFPKKASPQDSPGLRHEAGRMEGLPFQRPEPLDHLLGDLASPDIPIMPQKSCLLPRMKTSTSHAHFFGDRPAPLTPPPPGLLLDGFAI